jgi:hypothetical protein
MSQVVCRCVNSPLTRCLALVTKHTDDQEYVASLNETRVEFDEDKIDLIVSDVRDEAHLNARRATQGKYE